MGVLSCFKNKKGRQLAQRFDYDRLEPDQFRDRLRELDMPSDAFARIFGIRAKTVDGWLQDGNIPPWVRVALTLLGLPGALPAAREAAAQMIRSDNIRPELGSYPYLQSRKEST